ncbi:MAG: type II toxin-antitoxin system PemK/MazF family toxin [bacterium]|nr:type II toxin-antitoxin system PemK/MazF family toxin [bacterium]
MKKGEIWIVDIPQSESHEQSGKRPVVLVARLEANMAMVIPCTSNQNALRFPHTVSIDSTVRNGLSELSIALVFQLRAIDQKRLKKKIGVLQKSLLEKVDGMMSEMLGLKN